MRMVTATEANREFSKLLDRVAKGEAIGITKRGRVVATFSPATPADQDVETFKRMHIEMLRARKPLPGLKRGDRDELYDP